MAEKYFGADFPAQALGQGSPSFFLLIVAPSSRKWASF